MPTSVWVTIALIIPLTINVQGGNDHWLLEAVQIFIKQEKWRRSSGWHPWCFYVATWEREKKKKGDPGIKIKIRFCSHMGWRKLLSHYRTNKYHQLPDTKGKRKTTGKLASWESSSQLPRIILGLQLLVSAKFKELAVLKVYLKNATREFKHWPCKEKFHGEESEFPGYQGFG